MSLRGFLAAAYAVLVEAWTSIPSMDLLTAIDKATESIGLGPPAEAGVVVPSPSENERALAELQQMMSGMAR